MSTEALAVVFPTALEVVLEASTLPDPGPGEIACDAVLSLISAGPELTCLRGEFEPNTFWAEWVQYPFAPGYSMVSRVTSVGDGVTGFAPGDRVFSFTPHASQFVMPADEAIALPDDVTDEQACWTSLAITTQWAVRRADVRFGESAGVVGVGLLGQLLVRWLRTAGAARIVAIDTDAPRLAIAAAGGASETVLGRVDEALAADDHALNGALDVVFDVTGRPAALADATRLLRPLGRLVLVGDSPTPSQQRLGPRVVADGISIIGIHANTAPPVADPNAPWSAAAMAALFHRFAADGRMDPSALLARRIHPSDAPDHYRHALEHATGELGVFIDWQRT